MQRALGAVSLKEAQKGLLFTGILKILIPLVIVLPGIIGFYYFGDTLFDSQDSVYPELVKRVLPPWMTGFFVAVIMGAILSTFNSALNSAATIFSLDIFKVYIKKSAKEGQLVRIGKWVSAILAIVSILVAPFVANAPAGLYQLLQQLNGIFFIPMATVIIAGFFFPKVSAAGAKAGLVFGLVFYILMDLILKVNIHFVHIWGIEFILNLIVMHLVSAQFPVKIPFVMVDSGKLSIVPWRHAKTLGWILIAITVIIYVILGTIA